MNKTHCILWFLLCALFLSTRFLLFFSSNYLRCDKISSNSFLQLAKWYSILFYTLYSYVGFSYCLLFLFPTRTTWISLKLNWEVCEVEIRTIDCCKDSQEEGWSWSGMVWRRGGLEGGRPEGGVTLKRVCLRFASLIPEKTGSRFGFVAS